MKTRFFKALAASALLGLSATAFGAAPASATECIAPANPGGGWDFTCRQIGKILYELKLVDKPVKVTNMPGAGGGLAFNYVVTERNTDPDLIVAASTATTTRLAQNAYAGRTVDDVRFVGAIGIDPGVIAVAADSPYQSLKDLVDAALSDPSSVAFAGGSAVGGFDHMKPLMILKKAGLKDITKIKYIGVDGGADAVTQTVGGFTQAMTGDLSEIVGFLKSGDVRALAVLTEERVPGFEQIPTAREQGYDVVAGNWRGLYVPGGITDAQFQSWADKLLAVAESEQWKEAREANGLAPFTMVGDAFQGYVKQLAGEIREMSKELGVIQ